MWFSTVAMFRICMFLLQERLTDKELVDSKRRKESPDGSDPPKVHVMCLYG